MVTVYISYVYVMIHTYIVSKMVVALNYTMRVMKRVDDYLQKYEVATV